MDSPVAGIARQACKKTFTFAGCQKLSGSLKVLSPKRRISSAPARLAATRRRGISLEEICEEYGFSHSTAQRMTEAIVATFPLANHDNGEDRKRRWTLADLDLDKLVVSENL